MPRILHIDSSPRIHKSVSRFLASEFLREWRKKHPEFEVIYRDLAKNPPSYPTEDWVSAAYDFDDLGGRASEILKESNELVEEFLSADRYLVSTPMYCFSVPANLKAYMDLLARPKRTFAFEVDRIVGLVPETRRALFITARGGIYAGGTPWAMYDEQEPLLRRVFSFLGLRDIIFVNCEGTGMRKEIRDQSITDARNRLLNLARRW